MAEKRITVWVQEFKDRPFLMLQWHDPVTGKRKSKTSKTNDPKAADDARQDLEYELNNGLYAEASRMTWETFRDLFETEYLPGVRPATQKNYRMVMNLVEEIRPVKTIGTFDTRAVSAFLAAMRSKPTHGRTGLLASSCKVNMQFLHGILNWAHGQQLLPKMPKFPVVRVSKKNPQAVSSEAFERMTMKAEDPYLRAFIMTGWLAGLRLGEAMNLSRDETDEAPYLDLEHDRIVLPAEMVKGDKDQWVPLDPVLRTILDELPRHGSKVFRFASQRREALTISGMSKKVVALAKRAGVKLSMRALRRGFGCRYAGKVPAQVLQKLMRHSNIQTTMDYYANIDDAVEEAILGPKRNRIRNKPEKTDERKQQNAEPKSKADSY